MTLPPHKRKLPEIMQATPAGQRRVAIIAAIALAALAAFHLYALPQLGVLLDKTGPAPAALQIRQLQAVFILIGVLGIGTAAIVLNNGIQGLARAQSPASDAWLWRDTPILRGVKARRRSWINIVTGLFVGLICAGLVVYIVQTLERAMPPALRDGVTVVEQKGAPQ